MTELAVIDYGMGNLRSVVRAWEYVGACTRLITEPEQVGAADALVFPGQGAIVDCMVALRETGFDAAIREWIAADRPFFGICLGLQALFEHSEEGDTPGLGIFAGTVRRFRFDEAERRERNLKVPHMGWNTVEFWPEGERPVEHYYFVHSYFCDPEEEKLSWGTCTYGGQRFCAAARRGRCVATQFHPEKSQAAGLRLYGDFLNSLG